MGNLFRLGLALLVFCLGVGGVLQTEAAVKTNKKAILVVSFGTTYQDARQTAIGGVEAQISAAFPEYEVRRAFTSRIVVKRLLERDNIKVETETEALLRLQQEGYDEVIVQPLHIVAGAEYDKIKGIVAHLAAKNVFKHIELGRPLLYYPGVEGHPDDYTIAIDAVSKQLPALTPKQAVVFLGHGGPHPANAAYATLQMKFADSNFNNAYIYTVEGYPTLDWVMEKLATEQVESVLLVPFMLVAGDHVHNDMAGEEEDSAKSILEAAGFKVSTYLKGLGNNPAIGNVYVQHIKDVMTN